MDQTLMDYMQMLCADQANYSAEWTRLPFNAEFDGKKWLCAGDGYRVLMLVSDEPARGTIQEKTLSDMRKYVTNAQGMGYTTTDASLDDLKKWVGPAKPKPVDTLPPCNHCENTGELTCHDCAGTGDCECACGHEHSCSGCDGDGTVPCVYCPRKPETLSDRVKRMTEPGLIFGRSVNRRLIRDALSTCPTPFVHVMLNEDDKLPLLFRSTDDAWVLLLAPMTTVQGLDNVVDFADVVAPW